MKLTLTIVLFIIAAYSCLAQDYQNQFLVACEANDTIEQGKILNEWEDEDPNNPELYTSRFNYHFLMAQEEVLEISTQEPDGQSLAFQDSLGNNTGFIGSKIIYNPEEIDKALKYIDEGIAKNPDRLDMRFGKTYVLGQIEDWESFTKTIIATIVHSETKKSQWLWTDNQIQEGDNNFMLSAIQDYQLQLYKTNNDDLLINMRSIAERVLEIYPNHIESLSNLSVTYTLLGELDKALSPLLKAESINSEDYVVVANIANTYKELNNKVKAIEYYEKLITFKEDGVAEFAKQQLEMLKE